MISGDLVSMCLLTILHLLILDLPYARQHIFPAEKEAGGQRRTADCCRALITCCSTSIHRGGGDALSLWIIWGSILNGSRIGWFVGLSGSSDMRVSGKTRPRALRC